MTLRAIFLAVLAAVSGLTGAAAAAEWPDGGGDGGRREPRERRWKKTVVPIVFSNSLLRPGTALRPDSDVAGAIRRSLETWEAVAEIEFDVSWSDKTAVSPAGPAGDGLNLVTIAPTPENLLVFGGDAADIPARARVFFGRRGEISEADIVLNPYQQFSTDGAVGTFDLESTLTHEIGHLLGLEHSPLLCATMNESQGKNGTFNLPATGQRTLSEDDKTRIRALYGPRGTDECCGTFDGRLSLANGRPARGFDLWLEEAATGRVVTGGRTNADGALLLKGLEAGRYRVFAQTADGAAAGGALGETEVSRGRATVWQKRLAPAAKDFEIQFTGFNGQLSRLPIPLNAGKSYLVYIGGRNLDPDDLKIGTTSPHLTVTPNSATRLDYGRDLSVISFEVRVAADAVFGDYTLYVQDADGRTEYLPGSLTVERAVNPWSSQLFE